MFNAVKVRTTGLSRRTRVGRWMQDHKVTYWASFAFIGLVLVGLVIVLLPASWFTSTSTKPVPLPVADGDVVCAEQAPSTNNDGLLVPSWVQIGAIATPQSATGGPVLQGSPRQCFTHSTEGAVYAAASYSSEMTQETSVDKRREIVRSRVSQSQNFSQAMTAATQVPPSIAVNWSYIGYRVAGESPYSTTLELAIRSVSTGTVSAITYTMVWERNDWLVLIPDQGTEVSRTLTNFVGFTPWGKAG